MPKMPMMPMMPSGCSSPSSSSGFSSSDESDDNTGRTTATAAAGSAAVPTVAVDVVDELEPTDSSNVSASTDDDNESLCRIDWSAIASLVAPQCIEAATPLLHGALSFDYDQYTTALAIVSSHWSTALQHIDDDDNNNDDDRSSDTAAAYSALRAALYARFQRAFPLTPEMFTQWLCDLRDVGASDAETQALLLAKQRVFERALDDYLSVPLALQYAQFLVEHEDAVASFRSRAETLQRTLLRTAALHYTDGHAVWQWYREQVADSASASVSPREREARVRSLYERQLRVPLQQNDRVLSEFRAWRSYNTLASSSSSDAVFDALVTRQTKVFGPLLKKIEQFESRLEHAQEQQPVAGATEIESPEHVWLQYLNFATYRLAPLLHDDSTTAQDAESDESSLADAFVRVMYERAVAMVCLSATLWTKYAAFARASSSMSDSETLGLYERAVRNVPFDASTWTDVLLALEQRGDAIERISAYVARHILSRTTPLMMDQYHFLSVLTTYCDAHRRAAAHEQYSDAAMRRLEHAFATCAAFMETHFPAFALGVSRVLEYHAKCVLLPVQTAPSADRAAARAKWNALWATILTHRRHEADAWASFYHESVRTGAVIAPQEMRTQVFEPAMASVTDYPTSVLELWLVYERENGSLADYLRVRDLHTGQMARAAKAAAVVTQQTSDVGAPASQSAAPLEPKKRKAKTEPKRPSDRDAKRAKVATPHASDDAAHRVGAKTPAVPTGAAHASRAAEKKKAHDALTNAHTLFVSNLSKDVTQDELDAVFRPIAGLRDVRLVVKARANHVKSRGMAYIQFADEHGVEVGLAKNGLELKGRAISVERSKPPSQAATAGDSSAVVDLSRDGTWKTDPVTVYVGGLVRESGEHVGEDGLRSGIESVLQGGAGRGGDRPVAVKRVSILKDRRGKLKDYGLVELASERMAAACVAHLADIQKVLGDQVTLKPSRFSIDQILLQQQKQMMAKQQQGGANKSKHQSKTPSAPRPAPTGARVGGSAASVPRQRMPSLGLLPRALRRTPAAIAAAAGSSAPVASTASTTTAPSAGTSTSVQASGSDAKPAAPAPQSPSLSGHRPKTNDDFRKLLMKQ